MWESKGVLAKYDNIKFQNIISAWNLRSINQWLSFYSATENVIDDDISTAVAKLSEKFKTAKIQPEQKWSIQKWISTWSGILNQITNNDNDWIMPTDLNNKSTIPDSKEWKVLTLLRSDIISTYIEKRSEDSVYEPEISSKAIYEFVTKIPKTQLAFEQILKRLKRKKDEYIWQENFSNATFPLILADIQRSSRVKEFKKDLSLYTDSLIHNVYINTHGSGDEKQIWNIGTPYIVTPNAPKELASISMGSAILVFFIALKNWLNLEYSERSYTLPGVMLLDEIDSFIHPLLLENLSEVLVSIWKNTQLFITTHSPTFIDLFPKENIYYIKPVEKIGKLAINRSDVFSYKQILDILPEEDREPFQGKKNSELFVDGVIDDLYPIN